jgi:hypothetical protein
MKKLHLEKDHEAMEIERKRFKTIEKTLPKTINKHALFPGQFKDLRSGAVKHLCSAYKTAKANLKAGNIKYFNIGFKTETNKNKVLVLGSNQVSFSNGILKVNVLTDKTFYIDAQTLYNYPNLKINNNHHLVDYDLEQYLSYPLNLPTI